MDRTKRTRIFMDTEFTGLYQDCDLLSIGMVSDTGREFYAEIDDFVHLNDWVLNNVAPHLRFADVAEKRAKDTFLTDALVEVKLRKKYLAVIIHDWLGTFGPIEIWSDVLAYDWVLFCNLFEHSKTDTFNDSDERDAYKYHSDLSMQLPDNLYYIPFDIATLMKVRNVCPDITREDFVGIPKNNRKKHDALWDAKVMKMCYDKLMVMELI